MIFLFLKNLPKNKINKNILSEALVGTTTKRGTLALFDNKRQIISEIKSSTIMQDLWEMYQKKYDYATNLFWDDVMGAVENI